MKIPKILPKLLSDYFRWLAGLLVVLVFVFGYFGFISAKFQEIQTAGFLEQKKVLAELNNRQEYLKNLNISIAEFNDAFPPDKLQALNEFIPSKPDFPSLMLTLKNIATSANLQLDNISTTDVGELTTTGQTANVNTDAGQVAASQPTVKAAEVAGINLQVQNTTISVSGGQSYDAFKSFIGLIESSQRLFDVTSLSFSSGGADTKSDYAVQIRSYYLPGTN